MFCRPNLYSRLPFLPVCLLISACTIQDRDRVCFPEFNQVTVTQEGPLSAFFNGSLVNPADFNVCEISTTGFEVSNDEFQSITATLVTSGGVGSGLPSSFSSLFQGPAIGEYSVRAFAREESRNTIIYSEPSKFELSGCMPFTDLLSIDVTAPTSVLLGGLFVGSSFFSECRSEGANGFEISTDSFASVDTTLEVGTISSPVPVGVQFDVPEAPTVFDETFYVRTFSTYPPANEVVRSEVDTFKLCNIGLGDIAITPIVFDSGNPPGKVLEQLRFKVEFLPTTHCRLNNSATLDVSSSITIIGTKVELTPQTVVGIPESGDTSNTFQFFLREIGLSIPAFPIGNPPIIVLELNMEFTITDLETGLVFVLRRNLNWSVPCPDVP